MRHLNLKLNKQQMKCNCQTVYNYNLKLGSYGSASLRFSITFLAQNCMSNQKVGNQDLESPNPNFYFFFEFRFVVWDLLRGELNDLEISMPFSAWKKTFTGILLAL